MLRAGHHLRDLNWRELKVLAEHTRHGDALYRVANGEKGSWSQETHAEVTTAEAIDSLIWVIQCAYTPAGQPRPPRPKPRPRPGDEPDEELLTGEPMRKDQWADFWETGVHPNGQRESGDGLRPDHPDS